MYKKTLLFPGVLFLVTLFSWVHAQTENTITTVIIPAAGLGTRLCPVTKAVPKEMVAVVDGKPAIQLIVEEGLDSGINHFVIVVGEHKTTIQDYFQQETEYTKALAEKNKSHLIKSLQDSIARSNFSYIKQNKQLGLGHAVLQAKEVIKDDFFAVALPDDFIVGDKPGLEQLASIAREHKACVIAVQEVPEEAVSSYGVIAIKREVAPGVYEVKDLVEKPKMKDAPSRLAIVGRYILNKAIFPSLEAISPSAGGEYQLTDAIAHMMRTNPDVKVYAYKFKGERHDVGNPLGWTKAVIALALQHPGYKEQVKACIKELLREPQVMPEHLDHSEIL